MGQVTVPPPGGGMDKRGGWTWGGRGTCGEESWEAGIVVSAIGHQVLLMEKANEENLYSQVGVETEFVYPFPTVPGTCNASGSDVLTMLLIPTVGNAYIQAPFRFTKHNHVSILTTHLSLT